MKYLLLELFQVKLAVAVEDYSGYFRYSLSDRHARHVSDCRVPSDVVVKTIDLGARIPQVSDFRIVAPGSAKAAADPLHDLVR